MAKSESLVLFSLAEVTEFFEYLDELRLSGETNMMGAGPYLVNHFGLSREKAREILAQWLKSFGNGTESAAKRARVVYIANGGTV